MLRSKAKVCVIFCLFFLSVSARLVLDLKLGRRLGDRQRTDGGADAHGADNQGSDCGECGVLDRGGHWFVFPVSCGLGGWPPRAVRRREEPDRLRR